MTPQAGALWEEGSAVVGWDGIDDFVPAVGFLSAGMIGEGFDVDAWDSKVLELLGVKGRIGTAVYRSRSRHGVEDICL